MPPGSLPRGRSKWGMEVILKFSEHLHVACKVEQFKSKYSKCSKISNTFLVLSQINVGYQGWNSQVTCQNSKQGRP